MYRVALITLWLWLQSCNSQYATAAIGIVKKALIYHQPELPVESFESTLPQFAEADRKPFSQSEAILKDNAGFGHDLFGWHRENVGREKSADDQLFAYPDPELGELKNWPLFATGLENFLLEII